ncbi:hypothetical protein [Pseudotabrizicola formosa]|uniref:hypothetical protein n=1 Tax=Pseudotabrizicola formosa TaxID=2030009 RepID=UPI000CD029F0|nr:hypothetical protein [Pseudotabrizicola formosa]
MPKLIRLYIVNVAIGFGIAVAFVAGLLWLDVAGLRHLVLQSPMGWVAAIMMVMVNGVVFGGVQFAIAVMRMAESTQQPPGGTGARLVPVPVLAKASARPALPGRPRSSR